MFERAFALLKPSKVMFDTRTLLYGVFPGLLGQRPGDKNSLPPRDPKRIDRA